MIEKILIWTVPIITLVIAVSIGLAHFFGFLDSAKRWFQEYGLTLVVLLLSMIAIILNIVSTRLHGLKDSFDSVSLSTRLQQLQNRLDAVSLLEIRQFNSPHDIYQYWTQRLHSAKKSVDDLTWGHYPPHYTFADKEALKTYVDYIPKVCGRGTRYREVMTFPNIERVRRAKQMLLRQNEIHNYHLRYYDLGDHIGTPPLIQFSVIDYEEVFIFFYREPSAVGTDELRLAVRHPTIVKLFVDYFESIWKVARQLKQGDVVSKELLEEIQATVEKFSSPQKPTPL